MITIGFVEHMYQQDRHRVRLIHCEHLDLHACAKDMKSKIILPIEKFIKAKKHILVLL